MLALLSAPSVVCRLLLAIHYSLWIHPVTNEPDDQCCAEVLTVCSVGVVCSVGCSVHVSIQVPYSPPSYISLFIMLLLLFIYLFIRYQRWGSTLSNRQQQIYSMETKNTFIDVISFLLTFFHSFHVCMCVYMCWLVALVERVYRYVCRQWGVSSDIAP